LKQSLAQRMQRARQGALLREGHQGGDCRAAQRGQKLAAQCPGGAELAIVTPVAGTTRDKVQQTIQIEGVPLHVIDTAGLRDSDDEVEKLASSARLGGQIAGADAVLFLHDLTRAGQRWTTRARTPRSPPCCAKSCPHPCR
jgi:tRNA modification GTPase